MATSQPPAPDEATKQGVHALMLNMQPSGTDLAHIAQLLEAGTLKVDVARTYRWRKLRRPGPIARDTCTRPARPRFLPQRELRQKLTARSCWKWYKPRFLTAGPAFRAALGAQVA